MITQQEAAKAKKLAPPKPNKAEALVSKVEEILLESPSGFYPFFGSVWSGGGFTLGAGYRQFTGDNTFFDIKGLYLVLELQVHRNDRRHARPRRRQGQRGRAPRMA